MKLRNLAILSLLLQAVTGSASAQQPADSFPRQVTVYIGYAAGGGYDLYARLFASHLGKHLPGNPVIVPRNEPGAGSFKLANELFNTLPKDGSALGTIGDVLVIHQVLGDPIAKFVARDFTWIGRFADSDPVLVTRPDSGVATMQDGMTREAVIGVPGAGSATGLMLSVVNSLLGAKFKLVSGYEGSTQIKLAVERGEVHGSASTLWRVDRGWIRDNKLNVLYQASLESAPDLPNVPRLVTLGRDEDERRLLAFFCAYTTVGRSIIAPPGLAPERAELLRKAFDATVADPAFVADAKKANLDLAVLPGKRLAEMVAEAANLQGDLLVRAKALGAAAK